MSNHTLKLHVEGPGTDYTDADGRVTQSMSGHVWLQVTAPDGRTFRAGFGPKDPKSGPTSVPGQISTNDDTAYSGDPIFTATHQITKGQADTLERFFKDPSQFGFNKELYHALMNSCVDFAWAALGTINMNPKKSQGKLLPMDNIIDFFNLVNPLLPPQIDLTQDLFANPRALLESVQLRPPTSVDIFLSTRPPLGAPPEPRGTVTVGPLSPVEIIRKYQLRPLSEGDCLIWNLDRPIEGIDPGDHSVCRAYYSGSAQ